MYTRTWETDWVMKREWEMEKQVIFWSLCLVHWHSPVIQLFQDAKQPDSPRQPAQPRKITLKPFSYKLMKRHTKGNTLIKCSCGVALICYFTLQNKTRETESLPPVMTLQNFLFRLKQLVSNYRLSEVCQIMYTLSQNICIILMF